MVFILRVLQIAVRWIGAERLAGIALRLEHSLYFPAGVFGVELVENVDEGRHVVFRAVDTVHAVVDGDEADVVGREKHLRVHTDLKVVPSEAAHILDDDDADFVLVDHADEPLPIRSVEIGPTVAIVYLNAVFDTNGKASSGAQSAGKGLISWAFAVLPIYPTGLRKPCFSFQ